MYILHSFLHFVHCTKPKKDQTQVSTCSHVTARTNLVIHIPDLKVLKFKHFWQCLPKMVASLTYPIILPSKVEKLMLKVSQEFLLILRKFKYFPLSVDKITLLDQYQARRQLIIYFKSEANSAQLKLKYKSKSHTSAIYFVCSF